MNTVTLESALIVRAAAEGSDIAATVEGMAVPYGVETRVGNMREQFAPGAFDPAQVIGRALCWRHDEPVGVITDARNEDDGLYIVADIADTSLGRDAATLLRTGAARGLSVGFSPIKDSWNSAKDAVTRMSAALGELSITHQPAYATAGVSAIREENPVDDSTTTVAEATETRAAVEYATAADVQALRERIASVSTVQVREAEPVAADEYLREYAQRLITRAWTDVTLNGTASDNSPVPSAVSARINLARPTFSAIGSQPLPSEGMEAIWMLDNTDPTVGIQSAEKAVIPSGPAGGLLVKSDVVTIAGGNDVSLQFIQRASGWTLADYMQRLGEQYARNTNAMVLAELETTNTAAQNLGTGALDTAKIGAGLGQAAAKIASAVGSAPNLLILEPATFFEFAAVSGNGYPLAGGNVGNADLASLAFTAFGLRVICDPQIDADMAKGWLMDTRCIGIKESAGAPFSLTANVPSKLGQDIAVYGYAACKVLRAGGVVQIDRGAAAK